MTGLHTRELGLLLTGDLAIFLGSLWLSLTIRSLGSPTEATFYNHVAPFSVLFIVWVAVFFIAGLYDKQTVLVKKNLPGTIFRAQTVNLIIAALFFFAVPAYGIAPKTVLVIYLAVSSILILFWRLVFFHQIFGRKKARALLLGSGSEADEILHEINNNTRYDFHFEMLHPLDDLTRSTDPEEALLKLVDREEIAVVVVDFRDPRIKPLLPALFDLSFQGARVTVADLARVYESIFDRLPISLLHYDWFLKNIRKPRGGLYRLMKRSIDLIGGLILAGFTLAITPLIYLAIKLEDGGPLLIKQTRLGQYSTPMTVFKFRTMTENESASNTWVGESKNRVTRVGRYLRGLSIDEWPQAWNILRGEMSLIGPRNDIAGLAKRLEEHIPYYGIRTIITPGITGWAQTHQRYAPGQISPQSIEETKHRLAYDLYYIKHRSLLLDLNIALRTVKTLLTRIGARASVLLR